MIDPRPRSRRDDEEAQVGANRWLTRTFATLAVAAVGSVGVGGAFAQDQGAPLPGSQPEELVARLATLEAELPAEVPPERVSLEDGETWGTLAGDAGGVSAVLETAEPELRRLFVDADEADGEVADAVAEVARGWLEVWQGATSLAAWEAHDLAFPVGTFDEDDLATGADELRGVAEIGLDLILDGRARHLAGYAALSDLTLETAPEAGFEERAESAEAFQNQVRPQVLALLSEETTAEMVVVERFETEAPGVEPRASSMTVTCVDRDALDELGGVATPEVLVELEDVSERADCPERPDEL